MHGELLNGIIDCIMFGIFLNDANNNHYQINDRGIRLQFINYLLLEQLRLLWYCCKIVHCYVFFPFLCFVFSSNLTMGLSLLYFTLLGVKVESELTACVQIEPTSPDWLALKS